MVQLKPAADLVAERRAQACIATDCDVIAEQLEAMTIEQQRDTWMDCAIAATLCTDRARKDFALCEADKASIREWARDDDR